MHKKLKLALKGVVLHVISFVVDIFSGDLKCSCECKFECNFEFDFELFQCNFKQ